MIMENTGLKRRRSFGYNHSMSVQGMSNAHD